jgi:hypothetical protein
MSDEPKLLCERCGKTIRATETHGVAMDGRMVGISDVFSHVCVDGWVVHPFEITPFPDSAAELRSHIYAKLGIGPETESDEAA